MSQAQARLKEGYADYFRTRGDLFSALLYDLHSLIIDPQMRRVKNTLGNLKKSAYYQPKDNVISAIKTGFLLYGELTIWGHR